MWRLVAKYLPASLSAVLKPGLFAALGAASAVGAWGAWWATSKYYESQTVAAWKLTAETAQKRLVARDKIIADLQADHQRFVRAADERRREYERQRDQEGGSWGGTRVPPSALQRLRNLPPAE
jgi:hypothetical protein